MNSYMESRETYTSLFEDKSRYEAIMSTPAEMMYTEARAKRRK